MDGMGDLTEFSFESLMDLVRAVPTGTDPEFWAVICALLSENANQKQFFRRD